jgi:hypothetical protein
MRYSLSHVNRKERYPMTKSLILRERLAALKSKKIEASKKAKSSTLRERLAALKSKKIAASKEAKVKVASAWTVAKTLLPGAPNEVQFKLAKSIIALDTKILKACVKQAAVNAYWAKFAEDMEAAGAPLNIFVDDPSMIEKLKKELKTELQGDAKNASTKKQADGEVPEVEIPAGAESKSEAPKVADYEDPAEKQSELDAEEKVHLHEKIEVAENAIEQLEHEIMDGENEELDISGIFDNTDEKVDSLANEGDNLFGEEPDLSSEDTHGPSDTASLEEALNDTDTDTVGISEAADFFSQASEKDTDDFSDLFTTAAEDAEVKAGEAADYFISNGVDHNVTDAEEDHDGDLIFEVMMDLKPKTFETSRQTEPKLETPKAASAKRNPSKPIRSLGHVSVDGQEQAMLAKLVFPDDDEF